MGDYPVMSFRLSLPDLFRQSMAAAVAMLKACMKRWLNKPNLLGRGLPEQVRQ
jgi:hypothetical protein